MSKKSFSAKFRGDEIGNLFLVYSFGKLFLTTNGRFHVFKITEWDEFAPINRMPWSIQAKYEKLF